MPTPVSTTKMPRQSVTRSTWPPMSGAMIGATPDISIRVEKNRAISTPSYRSRTTARAMTMPAAPARPWSSRKPMSSWTEGAIAQIAVAPTYTIMPISSGLRRPQRSLIGPTTSWPNAIPAMHAVRVSWTVAAGAVRESATAGSAGRYMSMESGGSAVSPPRTRVTSRPTRRAAATAWCATGATGPVGAGAVTGSAAGMCPSVRSWPVSGFGIGSPCC